MKNLAEMLEVEVLLATYNGERFLREQIDSILAQDYPALRILASDDGSTDSTPDILREYALRFPARFHVGDGAAPSGSAKANFLRLMRLTTALFVCFADQDDVWLPGKVSRSMEAMRELERRHGSDSPLLVFTDLSVVDQELRTLHPSMWKHAGIDPSTVHRLQRLLGQAIVTGCTMTVNRPLLELACSMPPAATMHDRWIALLASAMGASAYISEPQVLYRQHGANVIGLRSRDTSLAGIKRRLMDKSRRQQQRTLDELQVEALLHQHGTDMPPQNSALLEKFLESSRSPSAFRRIWLTLRYGFRRQGLLANLALLLEPFRGRRRD